MILSNLNSVLSKFSTISLEEMAHARLMNRVETKFAFSAHELPELLDKLTEHYKILKVSEKLFSEYETVYFDTQDHFFYHEHHRKRKNRYKVRFRKYVDSNLTFFEIKQKRNGRVNKERIKVENQDFSIGTRESNFLLSSDVGQLKLQKTLVNSYNRITLVSKSSVERVTFDLNVAFINENDETCMDKLVIAELKQEHVSRTTPVYLALKEMQIKPYSLSKYCIGLLQTKDRSTIKYNRFKKKLMHINKIQQL